MSLATGIYLNPKVSLNSGSPPVFPYAWASAWGEDRYGLWMALDYQRVRVVFRWIVPGTFWMGSPENEKGHFDQEDRHLVTISRGFWLGDTAVTQALWQAVTGKTPSYFKGDELPVERVSWNDVHAFIDELNRFHPALKTRLPWEAEWEYACRAGSETAFYSGDDLTLKQVNYRGVWDWKDAGQWGQAALKATARVRSYPCNPWGLYEMHGNVWEWCADEWLENLGMRLQTDPWRQQEGRKTGVPRVIRGGSWDGLGRDARSADRSWSGPGIRNDGLGFRLALGH